MASHQELRTSLARVAESVIDANEALRKLRDADSPSIRHQQYGRATRDLDIVKAELRKMAMAVNTLTKEGQETHQQLPSSVFEPCTGKVTVPPSDPCFSSYGRATCDGCDWRQSKSLRISSVYGANAHHRTICIPAAIWKSHWQETGNAFGCLACHASGTGSRWYSGEDLLVHWRECHDMETLVKCNHNVKFPSARISAAPPSYSHKS